MEATGQSSLTLTAIGKSDGGTPIICFPVPCCVEIMAETHHINDSTYKCYQTIVRPQKIILLCVGVLTIATQINQSSRPVFPTIFTRTQNRRPTTATIGIINAADTVNSSLDRSGMGPVEGVLAGGALDADSPAMLM